MSAQIISACLHGIGVMDPQNSQQEDAPTVMVSGILMRMAEVGRRRVLIASTRARHRGPWCRRWMPGPKMGTQC